MEELIKFLVSPIFRILKSVGGLWLLLLGVLYPDTYGLYLAFLGAYLLLSGLMNFCIISPLFGYPFIGDDILKKKSKKKKKH